MAEERRTFDPKSYRMVQERIVEFWEKHRNGRIITNLMSDPSDFQTCRYKAEVYRDITDAVPAATGWAFEQVGVGSFANATSHEENCETSAIGRALANLGFEKSGATRASQEEMDKVRRMQDYAAHSRTHSPAPDATPAAAGIEGAAPKGLNNAQLVAALRADNWDLEKETANEIALELEEKFGWQIPGTKNRRRVNGAEEHEHWPSDVWDFIARQSSVPAHG